MKFDIGKDALLEKMSLASKFTSDKLTTSSALQGILLKGENNILHFYSTNLSMYFHTSLPIAVEETFSLVLEPRKIIEFLQFLPTGNVTIEIKDKQLIISQQKTKGNFPYLVSEDFPMPPEITEKEQTFDAQFFTKSLPLVMFSASNDDARPVLTGVNFAVSEEELLMVATDGFRLSLMKEKRKGNISSMIIPADFLSEVLRNVKDAKGVSFVYSPQEKIVLFKVNSDSFYSRLIEGDFPPFERVIPAEVKTTVKVDRADFVRNIKLISVFARDFSNVIVCEFSNGEMKIRPKKEGNQENSAIQEVDFEGENQLVAFNYKYLLDFLNHVDSKQVILEILRTDAPVVFKLQETPAFLHIIMPIRIQE